ncbi:MAG: 16S rRNA (adenine(1518)-N(6)/adenine(1519)-N(6))-dimethyltransferase RsmA, partial [Candidatus Verstraetearchaeota archaeon]|nr:16S rRNA (adenine(1518)-N(6)/adenine(1519)-N(6))-dimethyltransferase RsmA [Candidatus Verstraetearchaeota archaeon]
MIDRELLKVTKKAIKEAGIRPSKRKGQNYAVDPVLIRCLVDSAELSGREEVLEIGSGTGTLTSLLSTRAKKVIAVETDRASADYLRKKFAGSNVEVIKGDILELELPDFDRVVSNLPYSISTPITFKLLFNDKFNFGALSYQKEVADRLVALPATPQYSRISVAVSLLADVRRVADFPPDSFYPPPTVSSTVVVIKRRQTSKRIDWTNFDSALKFLFSQRKRTLRKALETYSKVSGEKMSVV